MKVDKYGYVTDEWLEMMSKEWLVLYVKSLKKSIGEVIDYINGESPDAGVSGKYIKDILLTKKVD